MPEVAVVFGAHHFITWLVIGAIAGGLAGRITRGGGFGCTGDIVVGLVGALVGGIVLHTLTGSDEAGSFLGECVIAIFGAVILLVLLRLVSPGRGR